jgi:hypothetical protein
MTQAFEDLQLSSILQASSLPAETTWFLAMTEQITTRPVTIRNGTITLPQAGGSAALIDWKRLKNLSN